MSESRTSGRRTPHVMENLQTEERVLALTFDDGPDAVYTPGILDVLDSYRIRAAFFCIGSAVASHEALARRIVDSGHLIGNHTWSHPHPANLPVTALLDEVARTTDAIVAATGQRPVVYRPPYGELSDHMARAISAAGYRIVRWSVDSLDWSGIAGPKIAANVLSHLCNGAILLHHSAEHAAGTLAALPYIIEVCAQSGYRFARLDEGMGGNAIRE